MKSMAQLFTEDSILLDLPVMDKAELFRTIAKQFEQKNGLRADEVFNALEAREKLDTTGLGGGVAIPHARVSDLTDVLALFVRTRNPIDFAAPDGAPVNCFFVLLAPEKATEAHLRILSEIAERPADIELRGCLQTASSLHEVCKLITGDVVQIPEKGNGTHD